MRNLMVSSVLSAVLLVGCSKPQDPVEPQIDRAAQPPTASTAEPIGPRLTPVSGKTSQDITAAVRAINARHADIPTSFRKGHVTPRKLDAKAIKESNTGFTIQLPSKTPVPTPTVYRGKLYVSGGFSSKEYYCFDAATGQFVWGLNLDDDGPTSAVPYDDAIIFNTESCTIFAVHAETGKMLWSYWLGDPLMSTPTVAGGKVYTVYPARGSGGGAALPANQPETPTGSQLVAGSDDKSESPDDDASPDAFTKKGSLLKAFDVDDKDVPQLPKKSRAPAPYVAICLDAMTGKILWQRWVDGDCMSAPVAVGEEVYITTLPGTVYKFRQTDGEILSARRERATSAPVIVAGGLYYTKRIDDEDGEGTAREAIAIADQQTATVRVLANQRDAPYLDRAVQEKAASAVEANTFEQGNGIFGGFGGGFSGGGNLQGPADGEVQNSAPGDEPSDPPEDGTAAFDVNPFGVSPADNAPENLGNGGLDALAVQQQGAARNIGQGNVSMLQGYQGSRVLNWGRRNYNVMGDELVCTSAHSGKAQWRCPLSGDLKKVGGSLAAAPVPAGDHLLLATLEGNVLRVDPKTGKVHHRYEIGSPMRFSPAVDGGRIYVGTQDGRVVCIDTGDASVTGWPMWGGNAAHTGAN